MEYHIEAPISKDVLSKLRTGDNVYITGGDGSIDKPYTLGI